MCEIANDVGVVSFDEEYRGFGIYIEVSPDRYRAGFEWSVSCEDECYESDLEFTIEECLIKARDYIDQNQVIE